MTIKQRVEDWLKSGKDYDEGILILSKYSKQKILIHSLANGEPNPRKADKLLYELTKLAGLQKRYKKHSGVYMKERRKIKQAEAENQENTDNPDKPDKPDEPDEPPATDDKIIEVNDKTVIIVGSNEKIPFNKLPLIIQEVIKQKGNLYRQRDILHKEIQQIPEDNKKKNMDARALLVSKIDHISKRIDFLYEIQKNFETKKEVPDEIVLNWDQEPQKPKPEIIDHSKLSDIDLKNRQTNVRGQITKTKNMLKYQQFSKQEKENPMPDGPKKEKLQKKLETLEYELVAIQKELEKRK